MKGRTGFREGLTRWPFVLVSSLVPLFVVSSVFIQIGTAVPELRIDALEEGVVREVIPGGGAERAGIRAGDVIRAVNGVPFESYDVAPRERRAEVGESAVLLVERDGHAMDRRVPFVSATQVALLDLVVAVGVAVVFWGAGAIVLWRRFHRLEARFFFLLAEAMALGVLMPPLDLINWYPSSSPITATSLIAVGVSGPLLFHYHISYPVVLGSERDRRLALAGSYGAVAVAGAGYLMAAQEWLFNPVAVIRVGVVVFLLEVFAAVAAAIYVYARRAPSEGRRRLRVVTAGTAFSLTAATALYIVPAAVRGLILAPESVVRLLLLVPLMSYVLAIVRHGLFDIDRLLNRAALYGLLSLGVFSLYLGLLIMVERFVGGGLMAHTGAVAGLALLVGLSFSWTRARVQGLVDRLFYGGWYDYPAVVETVSNALAGSLQRSQLGAVLTEQVPDLMHLEEGRLWIGEADDVPPSCDHALQRSFPLRFRGDVRGLWTVGPRADGDPYSAVDERILETLARQAEIALSNILLVETLQEQLEAIRASRETLSRAQRRLLHSREEERARLARELHDGPIQALVGLKLEVGFLLDSSVEERSQAAVALEGIRCEVQTLLAELRQVCAELRPPILDTLGLGAAVQALTEDWSAECGVPVDLELASDGVLRSLDDRVAVNLYRIVQEALCNARRHAAAERVTVRLAGKDGPLVLSVRDDGRGFVVPDDFADLAAAGHFGLAGIGERADLMGASWVLKSAPGKGTALRVTWPDDGPTSL